MGLQTCIVSAGMLFISLFPSPFSHLLTHQHVLQQEFSDTLCHRVIFTYLFRVCCWASLFSSYGMCTPDCGAGEELSSWVGVQRVPHILLAVKMGIRNLSNVALPTGICRAVLMLENEDKIRISSLRISAVLAYFAILCYTFQDNLIKTSLGFWIWQQTDVC